MSERASADDGILQEDTKVVTDNPTFSVETDAISVNSIRQKFRLEIGHLEKAGYEITGANDLIPWFNSLIQKQSSNGQHELVENHREVTSEIDSLCLLTIEATSDNEPLLHDRKAVLMETVDGKKAIVSVVLFDRTDDNWYFGATGNYPLPSDIESPLAHTLRHSEKLAIIMRKKAYAIGVDDRFAGTKVIIGGEDWGNSPVLQIVTGALFSKRGPFPNITTGADVSQTSETLANMALGSRMGEGVGQIVGTENGLQDLSVYIQHSMSATYESLKKLLPNHALPDLQDATVTVQALGKIGSSAADMFIREKIRSLNVTDIALFPEVYPNVPINHRKHIKSKFAELAETAMSKNVKMTLVHPASVWSVEADIFCPCSSEENIVTRNSIDNMARSGVKVILSGANNPLANPEIASYAQQRFGILIPPEVLVNGGPATAAAFESIYLQNGGNSVWADDFIQRELIPYIRKNISEKIPYLIMLMRTHNISLYHAGEIAFYRDLQIKA